MRAGTTHDVWIFADKPKAFDDAYFKAVTCLEDPTTRIEGALSPQEAVRRAADGRWSGDDLYVVTQTVTRYTTRLWRLSLCPKTLRTIVQEIKG